MSKTENKSQFAWNVHNYLNKYIKFGDTKAAFICGLSGPLVFGLLQSNVWQSGTRIACVFCTVATLLFGVAFFCGFCAIWPDLFTSKTHRKKSVPNQLDGDGKESIGKGFIFWKHIIAHGGENLFVKAMEELDDSAPLNHVSHHNYELAKVVDRKYWWIAWGSRFFAIGLIALVVFAVTHSVSGSTTDVASTDSNSAVSEARTELELLTGIFV